MNKFYPKVSILVPCYNVENYLPTCLDSITNQTLKEIEIICINDGSTDKTLDIIKSYKLKDNRIVIIDKNNSGYGDSMNKGLAIAKGEYVGIVESDDFVDTDMFDVLYKTAKVNDLDICRSTYFLYSNNKDMKEEKHPIVPKNIVIKPLESTLPFYQAPAIWSAIYKNSFLKLNNINFLTTPGASYQDTSFAFKCYLMANRFLMIDKSFLHYRKDNINSSVKSKGKIYSVCCEWAEIIRYTEEKHLDSKIKSLVFPLQYRTYIWNFQRLKFFAALRFTFAWSKEWNMLLQKNYNLEKITNKKQYKNIQVLIKHPLIFFIKNIF